MNADTFMANFGHLADAPGGVQKLRELVLQLAVQGKLVEQDPEDEPASELLERIIERRAYLCEKKVIRENIRIRDKSLPNDSLPTGWIWTKFGDVTYNRDCERIPVRKTDREGQKKNYDYYGASGVIDKVADFLFDQPLLLIGEDGANLVNRSTPIAFIATGKYWVNNHAHVVDALTLDMLEFLGVYINSISLVPFITGMAQPKMNQARMNSISIPLPPLAEQKRIVAKVDELMAFCDELEAQQQERRAVHVRLNEAALDRLTTAEDDTQLKAAWSRLQGNFDLFYSVPENVKQLRQAILQLAVQGKLVEQDPDDEPASELLERIEKEVVTAVKLKTMKKGKAIPEYEDNLPFDLPIGWDWTQLGKTVSAETNAMCDGPFGSKLKTEHYVSNPGYAVIRLGNIGIGKFIWGKEGHISHEHFESLKKNHVKEGDLIVAGMAEPIARCCKVPSSLGPAVNKADCFRLRVHREIEREYMCYFLNSPVARRFATGDHHGMTRQRINLSNAKSMPVPLPPLAEQKRIVAKVDELMAQCDELELQLTQQQTDADRLTEAMVAGIQNGVNGN
jgi:type I restriction enzyme S subunit